MPELNWDRFCALPGDARDNFERLCRAAVSRTYARYGRFAAQAQQPGVEFHLEIKHPDCPLGDPGRWYGWQTKFWNLAADRAIGATRKADVLDSIAKTRKHLPHLTDWVLWTRRPLTSGDQQWFYGLESDLELKLWTAAELDELLIGDAELLRGAYFGDLILTDERLAALHQQAAAEVGDRWIPELHQSSPAENRVRRMLAEVDAWNDLDGIGSELERFTNAVESALAEMSSPLADQVEAVVGSARGLVEVLDEMYDQLHEGISTDLVGVGRRIVPAAPLVDPATLRRLRASQDGAALPFTNLLAFARDAQEVASNVEAHLATRVVIVTGEAGFGKTELGAALSASTTGRPAGVLLYGRRLSTHGTLDDLAQQVRIGGTPVPSFEALLAAVDAAAARAGCRLPIVIDGLNESESAMSWPPLLRSLVVVLEKYPSVVVVCTVRSAFLEDVVPSEVDTIVSLDGFNEDLDEAIGRYFEYFRIERGEAQLPRELLNHPLSLKIFCRVANPDRRHAVGAERLPTSLTGMFEEYLRAVGRRVSELHPSIHSHDVTVALVALGCELWITRARFIAEGRARTLLNDPGSWNESTLAALEQEGVLLRQPGDDGLVAVSLVYDLLAGHVIATSLLSAHGAAIVELLRSEETTELLSGSSAQRHPLAADIVDGLAGVMPRAKTCQLWQAVSGPLERQALLRAAMLDADYIDSETVEALAENVDILRGPGFELFSRLYVTRAAPHHPLNATFLDRVLLDRSVADRDLRWSEWLRANSRVLQSDAAVLSARWRVTSDRSDVDRLRARWMMWTLTSNDRALRDAATAALYWFGRHDVEGLFSLALDALRINDAYVGERAVAAAYGVTTSKQMHEPTFEERLSSYLHSLLAELTGPDPAAPTWHSLIRYYVSSTFDFAARFYPSAVPEEADLPVSFAAATIPDALREGDVRRDEADRTLGMDFGNYTLGRLFHDRANYDYKHPGHRDATDQLLGVVYELGWRSDLFEAVERSIVNSTQRQRDLGRLERYGKKYGWVGLQTVAGIVGGAQSAYEAFEVDIDPTFPQRPPASPIESPTWARPTPVDDRRWMRSGVVTITEEFLAPSHLDDEEGPWILVHAEVEMKDVATGRNTYGLFNTVIVDRDKVDTLVDTFNSMPHPGREPIDVPGDYYLFAGEIPWHPRFAAGEPGEAIDDFYAGGFWPRQGTPRFERISHSFNWEPYHSPENDANGYVPSRLFSDAFDLRSVPGGFDQVEPSGAIAARCFSAPPGFDDDEILYVRDDLVRCYAGDRVIVTFAFGERRIQTDWQERPKGAMRSIYMNHENVWRRVKVH